MKANAGPFNEIADYYTGLIDRFGHSPRACDYGRPESQQIKFRVLCEGLDLSGKSVLDVGCGFADFAEYLERNVPNVSYSGLDITPGMIAEARRLRPHLDLRVGNVLDAEIAGRFDVVMANGIFYLLGTNAWELTRSIIARLYDLAETAVCFNSLSAWAPDPVAKEFYADPLEMVAYCHTLSNRIVLRHDYHSRDFTIYMYKTR